MSLLLTFILALTLQVNVKGQNQLVLKTDPILTEREAFLLDSIFHKKRGSLTFKDKKVGFFSGHSFESLVTKDRFFQEHIIPRLSKDESPSISYIQLDPNQKMKSGGYDIIVLQIPKIIRKNQLKSNLVKLAETEL